MNFSIFGGNCPRSVSKDAKYRVKSNSDSDTYDKSVVQIVYTVNHEERWYPTTEDHPQLCRMVNSVKYHFTGVPHGSFYINEYKQEIVPVSGSYKYYYAGNYERQLRFKFDAENGNEVELSGDAVDFDGRRLSPGDEWHGPHPGIRYVLAAGGNDIYYKLRPRPSVEITVYLSSSIGNQRAAKVAHSISRYKGPQGGRFYVNEWGTIFAPVSGSSPVKFRYLGKIDMENWFPPPEVKEPS